MYRRIYSTEVLVINDLRSPSNKFDGTFDQLIIYSLLKLRIKTLKRNIQTHNKRLRFRITQIINTI